MSTSSVRGTLPNTTPSRQRKSDYLFPLFLYPGGEAQADLFAEQDAPVFNLNPLFVEEVQLATGLSFVGELGDLETSVGAVDIFHYVYAILHSPGYRARYAKPLRSGFPRVPLTADSELFASLVDHGRTLAGLHLLETPAAKVGGPAYPVPGLNVVDKQHPRYAAPGEEIGDDVSQGRVYISKSAPSSGIVGQYFEPVEPDVWDFHIGGIRVCGVVGNRRGRTLTATDLTEFQRIVVAIRGTLEAMARIDSLVPTWPMS